jgi:hypothetical protein
MTVPVGAAPPDEGTVAESTTAVLYIDGLMDEVRTVVVPETAKAEPALGTPLVVTTTLPVVAPVGTAATIDVALQFVIEVAAVPLNFTVLVP